VLSILKDKIVLPQQLKECLTPEEKAGGDEPTTGGTNTSITSKKYKEYYSNPKGGIVGLANLGNTCFLNSALQALLHCAPMVAFFVDLELKHDLPRMSRLDGPRLKLAEEFSLLTKKYWSGQFSVCAPREIVHSVWQLNPFFHGYGQHDSQEFIRCLLDNLHEGLKEFYNYPFPEITEQKKKEELPRKSIKPKELLDKDKEKEKEKEKEKAKRQEFSLISDIFQGSLLSEVRCIECKTVSIVKDPFYDLSLEMPKTTQLKRVSMERGKEALTPNNSGWFGSTLNALGITSAPLSLQTCLHSFCTSEELIKKKNINVKNAKKKKMPSKH